MAAEIIATGLITFLCCLAVTSSQTINNWTADCVWIEQSNPPYDPQAVDFDRLRLWEQCVFFNITSRRQDSNGAQGSSVFGNTALSIDPPPTAELHITVQHSELFELRMDESDKTTYIKGRATMMWKDPRLQWDKSALKLDRIRVHSVTDANQLWYPKMGFQSYHFRLPEAVEDWEVGDGLMRLDSDGTVSMSTGFDYHLAYTYDYQRYPFDTQKFCPRRHLENYNKPVKTMFDVDQANMKINTSALRQPANWRIRQAYVETGTAHGDIWLCVKVQRYAPTAQLQIVLPLVVATILAVLAPLFGGFRMQNGVKILVLILLYYALQDIIETTSKVNVEGSMPSLLVLYEFLTITTLVNIILSLILWQLARNPPKFGLPHRLQLLVEKCNSLLPLTKCMASDGKEILTEEGSEATTKNAQSSSDVMIAWLNGLLFVVFAFIYIIGMLVFYNY